MDVLGRRSLLTIAMWVAVWGCKDKDVDASGASQDAVLGEPCGDEAAEGADVGQCVEGLACEPLADPSAAGELGVCGVPLELRGMVFDAMTQTAVQGALVTVLDETGAPVGNVTTSDADGQYVLRVSARRDVDGLITDALKWTLFATARDYQPFPAGVRPAIPINAVDAAQESAATDGGESGEVMLEVIDNASTDVALLALPTDQVGGRTITGTIGGSEPGGTLVVAEGISPARYTVADASGMYTIFNVPDAAVSVVGYRRGLALTPVALNGAGDREGVDLALIGEGEDALPTVDGSVTIVNASGGAQTSVVLVPTSVYNPVLERGPVPLGLRAPQPPLAADVSGGFSIGGVPPGAYKVLAAFENDQLVRDPDEGIAGTEIVEVIVGSAPVTVETSFKVTEALAVISPGAEVPEVVSATPTFVFADDASEDGYEIVVYDAFGTLVWEDLEVPRVNGSSNVQVEYGGPALTSGMYYQFRATSMKAGSPIARTEDLRGVFVGP